MRFDLWVYQSGRKHEDQRGAQQQEARQNVQPAVGLTGLVFQPAEYRGAEETGEVADGIHQCDAGGGGSAGKQRARQADIGGDQRQGAGHGNADQKVEPLQ